MSSADAKFGDEEHQEAGEHEAEKQQKDAHQNGIDELHPKQQHDHDEHPGTAEGIPHASSDASFPDDPTDAQRASASNARARLRKGDQGTLLSDEEVLRFVSSVVPTDGSALLCTIVGDSFVKKYKQSFQQLVGVSFASWCKANTDAFVRKQLLGGHWVIARQTTLRIAKDKPTESKPPADSDASDSDDDAAMLTPREESDFHESDLPSSAGEESEEEGLGEEHAKAHNSDDEDEAHQERMAENWVLLLSLIPPSPCYRVLENINEDCLAQTGVSFEQQCGCTIQSMINSQPGLFQTSKRMNGKVTEWLVRRRSEEKEEFPPMKVRVAAAAPASSPVSSVQMLDFPTPLPFNVSAKTFEPSAPQSYGGVASIAPQHVGPSDQPPAALLRPASKQQLAWLESFPDVPSLPSAVNLGVGPLTSHPSASKVLEALKLVLQQHPAGMRLTFAGHAFSRIIGQTWKQYTHGASLKHFVREHASIGYLEIVEDGDQHGAKVSLGQKWGAGLQAALQHTSKFVDTTRSTPTTGREQLVSAVPSSSPSSHPPPIPTSDLISMLLRCLPGHGHSVFLSTVEKSFVSMYGKAWVQVSPGMTLVQFVRQQSQAFELLENDDGRYKVGRTEQFAGTPGGPPGANGGESVALPYVNDTAELKLALLQLLSLPSNIAGIRRYEIGNAFTLHHHRTFSSTGAQQGIWRYVLECQKDGTVEVESAGSAQEHSSGQLVTLTQEGRKQAASAPFVQLTNAGALSPSTGATSSSVVPSSTTIDAASSSNDVRMHPKTHRPLTYERSCRHFKTGFCGHGTECKYGHMNPPYAPMMTEDALSVTDLRKAFRKTFQEKIGPEGCAFFALGRVVSQMTQDRPWCLISPALTFEDFFQQRLDAGEFVATNPLKLGESTIYLGENVPTGAGAVSGGAVGYAGGSNRAGEDSGAKLVPLSSITGEPAGPLGPDSIIRDLLSILPQPLPSGEPNPEWMDAVQVGAKFARLHGFQPFAGVAGVALRVFVQGRPLIFDTAQPSGSVLLVRRRFTGVSDFGTSNAGVTNSALLLPDNVGYNSNATLPQIVEQILHVIPANGFVLASQLGNSFRGVFGRSLESALHGKKLINILHAHPNLFVMTETKPGRMEVYRRDSCPPEVLALAITDIGTLSQPRNPVDRLRDPANVQLVLSLLPEDGSEITGSELGHAFTRLVGHSIDKHLHGYKLLKPFLSVHPDVFEFYYPVPGTMVVRRKQPVVGAPLGVASSILSKLHPTINHQVARDTASQMVFPTAVAQSKAAPREAASQNARDHPRLHDESIIRMMLSVLPPDGSFINATELGIVLSQLLGMKFDIFMRQSHMLRPFLEHNPRHFRCDHPNPQMMRVAKVMTQENEDLLKSITPAAAASAVTGLPLMNGSAAPLLAKRYDPRPSDVNNIIRPTDSQLVQAILSQLPHDGSPLLISMLGDRFSRLYQGRKWNEVTGSSTPSFTGFIVARKVVFRTEGTGHTMLVARVLDDGSDQMDLAQRQMMSSTMRPNGAGVSILNAPTSVPRVPPMRVNGVAPGGFGMKALSPAVGTGGTISPSKSPAPVPPKLLTMKELSREIQVVLAHPSSTYGIPLSQFPTHFHAVSGRSLFSLVAPDFNISQFLQTLGELGSLDLQEERGEQEMRVKLPQGAAERIAVEEIARANAATAVAQAYGTGMKKLTAYAAPFTPGLLSSPTGSASSSPSSLLKPIQPSSTVAAGATSSLLKPLLPTPQQHHSNALLPTPSTSDALLSFDIPSTSAASSAGHGESDLIFPDTSPTSASASSTGSTVGGAFSSDKKAIPFQLEVLFDLLPPGSPAVRIDKLEQLFQEKTRWPFVGNLKNYLTGQIARNEFHVFEQPSTAGDGEPPVWHVRRLVQKQAMDSTQAYL